MINDLNDYWDSIKTNKKIGVILSLRAIHKTGHPGFVNITHYEFLSAVFNNIGEYLLSADQTYLIFLKDFYQNIINLSNPMNKEYLDFYYKHQENILDLTKIMNEVNNHANSEIDFACDMLDKRLILGEKLNRDFRYYQSSKNKNLMFTIYFADLTKDNKELKIMIELKLDVLVKKEAILKLDFKENARLIKPEFVDNTNKTWAHFTLSTYKLNNENIINLKEFIVQKINDDGILSIFETIENVL